MKLQTCTKPTPMLAIIIDDEPDAREMVRQMIHLYTPQFEVVGEAGSVRGGIQLLREHAADVVFLDVQLEDGTGFDLLDCFPLARFQVVFTTAFDAFALKAFRYYAVDYLLKPLAPREWIQAVNRLKDSPDPSISQSINGLKESIRSQQLDKIAISTAEGITFLPLVQIVCMESEGNYTTFMLETGEKVVASKGIGDFEELLPESEFCRIHQSHIVQIRHVKKLLKEDGGYALMSTGAKIPVSRRRKDAFLELLMQ